MAGYTRTMSILDGLNTMNKHLHYTEARIVALLCANYRSWDAVGRNFLTMLLLCTNEETTNLARDAALQRCSSIGDCTHTSDSGIPLQVMFETPVGLPSLD
jgi:hypothetical protein